MMATVSRRIRNWFRIRPGLPTTLLGAAYATYGLVHVWQTGATLVIDWLVVGLYELLALAVVYAGTRVSSRTHTPTDGLQVFGATVVFGAIGFVVAAGLIVFQLERGVPIQAIPFLLLAASGTTAAIGVALALYYVDLRAERANLAAQHETVAELNKRLTVLHRVLRHNLRNELTVVRGHIDLLLEGDPDPEVERSLETVHEYVSRIEAVSENAYRLRRVWAEDAHVDHELTELVDQCVRELGSSYPDVTVTTDLPAHAPARAHPRLQLAVTEALENAVVHNDQGDLAVAVSVTALDGTEEAVEISIADTGAGIPDSEIMALELVEESPLHHATGLGLWLMYWVIEQSDGTLRFEENDPQGAVVRMRLPGAEG